MTEQPYKPKRQQRAKDDFGSKTKPKGSAVVGRQATTLFGAGPNAPKPGVTSEARIAAIKAAEIAAKLQLDFLSAYAEKVTKLRQVDDSADAIIELVNSNSLKMINDAIDRAHGKATSSVDLTSSDGSAAAPSVIRIVSVNPDQDGS